MNPVPRNFTVRRGIPRARGTYRVLLVGCGDLGRELAPLLPQVRIAEAANAFEAGWLTSPHRPQAVLVDLGMGRSAALDLARRLRVQTPTLRLIALVEVDEPGVLDLGEHGFTDALFRTLSVRGLAKWIKTLAGGER